MDKANWIWGTYGDETKTLDIKTYVGGVLVSTIGSFKHGGEIIQLGYNRWYETMVFASSPPAPDDTNLGKYVTSWADLDFRGYDTAEDACNGHNAMCEKWAALDQEAQNDAH